MSKDNAEKTVAEIERVFNLTPVNMEAPPTMRLATPMAMIDRALAANAAPETLEKLLELQERWEANQARKAFDAALAAAKEEIEPIAVNRTVAFEGKNGKSDTNYRFEDLAQIDRQVRPILSKFGLSYRWRTDAVPDQPVTVTCILSHRDGHYEATTLSAGRDTSGNKNSIQAIGSTVTYLQRYTLKAALGLAVAHDDDGQASGQKVGDDRAWDNGEEYVSREQVQQLLELIEATDTPLARFYAWAKIDDLAHLPARHFDQAVSVLNQRRK